jgi:hypothetical protein
MSLIMNNTLGHFFMRSVVWRQLIRALRVYKRLLTLAVLIAVPGIAHSGSQPPWVTDLNEVVIIGVEAESFSYRELIRELTLEAGAITGLALPMRLPLVTIADSDTVSKYACQGKCKAVGAFHPVYGIAIAKHMNPLKNDLARSILLHELVHFLQHENKLYATANDCIRWFKRERQAYAAQNKFLRKAQSTTRVANSLSRSCRLKSS